MKISKSYKLLEFLHWTRRKLFVVLALAITPVVLYQLMGQKWIALPWSVAVLLGTATSFIVGFRNVQTYNRTVEAQHVWTAIASASRYWGTISRDFPANPRSTKALIHRHLAWLTALRYELRGRRVWESVTSGSNAEYRKRFYVVPEAGSPLEVELAKYLPKDELEQLAAARDKATRLIGAQSETIKDLYASKDLTVNHHTEMQRTLKDLMDQQSRAERIKNFPSRSSCESCSAKPISRRRCARRTTSSCRPSPRSTSEKVTASSQGSHMIDPRIIGTWKLKSTKAMDDDGKALPPPYGPVADGIVCFESDGRMYCVLCDGRSELPAGERRQFMSYAGNYTFDGTTLSTRVDASSDPARVGGDQVRTVRFENGGIVLAPPRRLYLGSMQHHELFWERIG